MTYIKRGEIWTVYNSPNKSSIREVVVLTNNDYNKSSISNLYTVVPLEGYGSTYEHPYDVRIRGKNVAIDLIRTVHIDLFKDKKAPASDKDMRNISDAIIKHLNLN
ncbi:MAG: type II toxin-antitoxin system PemK/MazF family toxin [Bacteroidota bacterium]